MAAPPAGARCAKHAEAAAVDLCQRCGSFVCSDCIEIRKEEVYCQSCAAILDRPPSKRIRAVFWISALWLPVMMLSVVFALFIGFGLALGLMLLTTPVFAATLGGLWIAELLGQRRGDAPISGRSRLVWSAAFIGLELLASLGAVGALVYFVIKRTPA